MSTVTTTYTWDALNRLLTVSYSDGTTPERNFAYDQSSLWSQTLQNPLGRLTEEWTGNSGPASPITAEIFSYDRMGRLAETWACTPANCGTNAWSDSVGYDLAGDAVSETRGPGYTLTKAFDLGQRPTGETSSLVDGNHPATLTSGVQYNAFGEPTQVGLGNGVSEAKTFDVRGRLTAYTAGSVYTLNGFTYAPDGDLIAATDSANGTWTYGYNQLNQLTIATCTANCPGSQSLTGRAHGLHLDPGTWFTGLG